MLMNPIERGGLPKCDVCGRDATHPDVFVVRVTRFSGGYCERVCNRCDEEQRRQKP